MHESVVCSDRYRSRIQGGARDPALGPWAHIPLRRILLVVREKVMSGDVVISLAEMFVFLSGVVEAPSHLGPS
jgi:hypothetical protein